MRKKRKLREENGRVSGIRQEIRGAKTELKHIQFGKEGKGKSLIVPVTTAPGPESHNPYVRLFLGGTDVSAEMARFGEAAWDAALTSAAEACRVRAVYDAINGIFELASTKQRNQF